jgi:hypothetical protein
MSDSTEEVRRDLVQAINSVPTERTVLESQYGQVWDTQQLTEDFSVQGFAAPFIVVTRKSDKTRGTLMFQHSPRYYFQFVPK